jgi:chaperonin GroES
MTFNQKLLDDFVVVELQTEAPGRIKLPEWQRHLRGRIVAAGPGKMLYSGERAPMACAVGDLVSFVATAGMDTSYGGHNVRLMRDENVDAVLEETSCS